MREAGLPAGRTRQWRHGRALLAALAILVTTVAIYRLICREQVPATRAKPSTDRAPDVEHPEVRSRRARWWRGLPVAVGLLAVVTLIAFATVTKSARVQAEDHTHIAVTHGSRAPLDTPSFTFESLGPSWPQARSILDDTVATARAHGFEMQLCLRALDSRERESHCAGTERSLYAASTIKVPLAVAALEKHGGQLDTNLAVGWEDIRGGSGTIKNDGAGRYPVGELIRRALVVSDNTAAAVLLRDLGSVEAANAPTRRLSPVPEFIVGNFAGALPSGGADDGRMTARGAAHYIAELVHCERNYECTLTTPEVAGIVLDHLRAQQIVTKIGLLLEPGTHATKGGDTDFVSHDIGVVRTARGEAVLTAVSTAYDPTYPDQLIADAAHGVVEAMDTTG